MKARFTDEQIIQMIKEQEAGEKPQQNGLIESFNSKLRDECLNETLFGSLAEVCDTLEAWQEDYTPTDHIRRLEA